MSPSKPPKLTAHVFDLRINNVLSKFSTDSHFLSTGFNSNYLFDGRHVQSIIFLLHAVERNKWCNSMWSLYSGETHRLFQISISFPSTRFPRYDPFIVIHGQPNLQNRVATQTPTNFQLEIRVTATIGIWPRQYQHISDEGSRDGDSSVNSSKTLKLLILVLAKVFQLMVVVRAGEIYTQSVYYSLQRTRHCFSSES